MAPAELHWVLLLLLLVVVDFALQVPLCVCCHRPADQCCGVTPAGSGASSHMAGEQTKGLCYRQLVTAVPGFLRLFVSLCFAGYTPSVSVCC